LTNDFILSLYEAEVIGIRQFHHSSVLDLTFEQLDLIPPAGRVQGTTIQTKLT
jgi:hypothetical protein